MKTYILSITFSLDVDGDILPKKLPDRLIDALIDNLNISGETNGMFMDSLQECISGDVVAYEFSVSSDQKDGQMKTRQAKLLSDGSTVTWYMFFVDGDGNPKALVEREGGSILTVYATWIEFLSE